MWAVPWFHPKLLGRRDARRGLVEHERHRCSSARHHRRVKRVIETSASYCLQDAAHAGRGQLGRQGRGD